jgi:cyclophilin family peptidyl-prolyl cis-trans isomerase/HEAT repeat protein
MLGFSVAFGLLNSVSVCAQAAAPNSSIPRTILLQIIRAEDRRSWGADLSSLMSNANPAVRIRAALAAGRIGNELAVPALVSLLQSDADDGVRAMAAFALGEVESPQPVEQLTAQLSQNNVPHLRARVVEALGKIAAALPATAEAKKKEIGKTVLDVLKFEARRRSSPDTEVVLLSLTATLRARPEGAGDVVAEFLSYSDSRIRSDAGNTLARLRAKEGNEQLRKLLTSDPDPNVRANAARVLGATEDKSAYDGLLDRALNDKDSRVRVSAIRALASLKDDRATTPLIFHGTKLGLATPSTRQRKGSAQLPVVDELLEIATAVGRLKQNSDDKSVFGWLRTLKGTTGSAPEIEIALARVSASNYLAEFGDGAVAKQRIQFIVLVDWREAAAIAQGFGEIAAVVKSDAEHNQIRSRSESLLRAMLDYRNSAVKPKTLVAVHSEYAIPDVLRALSAFKPANVDSLYRDHLKESDVVVRATAAELLGDLPLNITNIEALSAALKFALQERESNDAALAILDALAKQKNRNANQAVMLALESRDYLARRKAIEALKTTGAGDFSDRLGKVESVNTGRDYQRAISRIGKRVLAVVNTSKGNFTIELLPEAAPLNVDNFVQLAKRRYFNGIVFHRVVPNFVIQGGDPRGDGNGGPGYQIRCEINEVPYQRGAVGMALSGKDTGGSQWFVTHAPQPHLDGGYTVFGNVVAGMEVVDAIIRGDIIRSIVVTERPGPKFQSKPVDILIN